MRALIYSIIVLFLYSCGQDKSNRIVQQTMSSNEETDTIVPDTLSSDSVPPQIFTDFYTYTCKDGHKRVFFDYCWNKGEFWEGHALLVRNDNTPDESQFITLAYQRYNDAPDFFAEIGGIPGLSHYTVSKDKRYLYVVTRVHANSNGWTTEYQLFKVDCETLDAQFVCECAAIASVDTGFIIAVARITNEDTATCTADEIWVMHDEYLDWDGNVTKVSKQEYSYKAMEDKYLQGEYTLIKGFSVIVD